MPNISEKQWYEHPDFRRELEDLLNHPTMQIALGIVTRKGSASTLPVSEQIMEWFALMGAKKDGYAEGIANLIALSKHSTPSPPARKAWDSPHKMPDNDASSAP